MSHLQLRNATLGDRNILNRIKRDASLVSDEYREALLAHSEFLAVPEDQIRSGQVVVAEDTRQIVGLAAVSRREDGLELDGLFVNPAQWKRGIGRFLVEGVIAHFSRNGASETMHVVASPDAQAFYLACGFRTVGDTGTLFGPAILMRLDGQRPMERTGVRPARGGRTAREPC